MIVSMTLECACGCNEFVTFFVKGKDNTRSKLYYWSSKNCILFLYGEACSGACD